MKFVKFSANFIGASPQAASRHKRHVAVSGASHFLPTFCETENVDLRYMATISTPFLSNFSQKLAHPTLFTPENSLLLRNASNIITNRIYSVRKCLTVKKYLPQKLRKQIERLARNNFNICTCNVSCEPYYNTLPRYF